MPFADINSYESDIYEGWHQEHPAGDDSIAWSEEPAGVQLGESGPAQLINGLGAAGFEGVETPVTELVSLIQSASVDVEEGVVSFQVGLFQGADRNNWTTLRPVVDGADLSSPDTLWRGTGSWHDDNLTLDELTSSFDVDAVYLAGFGVHAENEAVVSSITWGGTTFQFVEELTEVEDPEVEDGENGDDNGEEDGDDVNGDEDEDLDDNDNGAETDDETSADDADDAAATPVTGNPSYTG